ncbi:hypothetical protein BDZ91DRAFT_721531 [Kalaharituber pfeilii]|nr:hypothetical protein BDZ91DRAFT_721531 [Kalaharituber pfeilii]
MASLPNLRKLFALSRTEEEERTYSRMAFYNLILFVGSIAAFSYFAQRMTLATSKGSGR